MRSSIFINNIIRKQKMLNERHEDLVKIKQKGNLLREINVNIAATEESKLLTSNFIRELDKDPILIDESESGNSWWSSQLIEFSVNSSRIDRQRIVDPSQSQSGGMVEEQDYNISLKKLLHSLIANDSDSSCLSIHDFTKPAIKKRRVSIEHKNLKKQGETVKMTEGTKSMLGKIDDRLKTLKSSKSCRNFINKSSKSKSYRTIENQDVREHPSIDNSKSLPNPTKEKYKKYITQKRSASKGVFDYDKTYQKDENEIILKDIKNHQDLTTNTNTRNSKLNGEAVTTKNIEKPHDFTKVSKQNIRHMRTKTMNIENANPGQLQNYKSGKKWTKKFTNSKKKSPKILKNSKSKRSTVNENHKIQSQSSRINLGSTRVNLDHKFSQFMVKNTTWENTITPKLNSRCGNISQKESTTIFESTISHKKYANEKKSQSSVRNLKNKNTISDKIQIKSHEKK
jgi:hypothetical protein